MSQKTAYWQKGAAISEYMAAEKVTCTFVSQHPCWSLRVTNHKYVITFIKALMFSLLKILVWWGYTHTCTYLCLPRPTVWYSFEAGLLPEHGTYLFLRFLFLLCVCVSAGTASRRNCKIPWSESSSWLWAIYGNWIWILCKSSMCS